MGEKERNFLASLGLLLSIAIFAVIIFHTIDFNGIKIKSESDKMMNYLSQKQYNQFYENLSIDSLSTFDKFNNYQENIDEILGDIKEYKYVKAYKSKAASGEEITYVEYNLKYSKEQEESIRIVLGFTYSNGKWKVSQYKPMLDNSDNDSELSEKLEIINSDLKEETKEVNDARSILTKAIEAYDNENYKYVYTMLSDELKEKGTEDEFINYLKIQHDKYGRVSDSKYKGYELSKDKSEYKFNYYMEDKNIYITIWITVKDKPYLSGINFSEDVW